MVLNFDKYKQKFCWKTKQLGSYKKMVLNLDKRSAMPNDLFSTAWHFSDRNLVAEQLVQFILITTSTIVINLDHCLAFSDKTLPCEDVNSVQLVDGEGCQSCRQLVIAVEVVDIWFKKLIKLKEECFGPLCLWRCLCKVASTGVVLSWWLQSEIVPQNVFRAQILLVARWRADRVNWVIDSVTYGRDTESHLNAMETVRPEHHCNWGDNRIPLELECNELDNGRRGMRRAMQWEVFKQGNSILWTYGRQQFTIWRLV